MKNSLLDAIEFLLHASKNGRGPAHQAQADSHLKALDDFKAELQAEAARYSDETYAKLTGEGAPSEPASEPK